MKSSHGLCLSLLGLTHIAVGVVSGWPQVQTIITSGVWKALEQQSQTPCLSDLNCLQLNTVWWFIDWGCMLLLFGLCCSWVENTLQQPLPAYLSWLLLFTSGLGACLMPASGFWLVMLVALHMLWCAHRSTQANKKTISQATPPQ